MPDETVVIGLEADTTDFRKGMEGAQKSVKGMGKTVETTAKQSSGLFSKFSKPFTDISAKAGASGTAGKLAIAGLTAFAVAEVGKMLVDLAKRVTDFAKKISMVANPMATSVMLDRIYTDLKKIEGAWGEAFGTDILQGMVTLMDYYTDRMMSMAQSFAEIKGFIAGLLGISIRIGDAIEGSADAMESATEGLAGFDKLTTLGDTSPTGMASAERIAKITAEAFAEGEKLNALFSIDLSKATTETFKEIGSKFGELLRKMLISANPVWKLIFDVSDRVSSWLTSAFQKVRSSLSGMFDGVWSGMLSGIKAVANGIIAVFNSVVDAYNSTIGAIRIDNDTLGIHIGFPKMENIPALASGDVIQPNDPHLVMVGDNRREQEVVSPLSTIRQAVSEAMRSSGGGQPVNLVVNLDSRTIARAVYDPLRQESRRRGSSLNL